VHFFAEATAIRAQIERKHGAKNAEMLLPLSLEEAMDAPNIRSAVSDELDPIVPSFMMHAAHWSQILPDRFTVVSDDSSTLENNQQVFLDYSNPLGTPVTANYHGQRIEYPLKVDAFRFVDSQTEPCIRVADLVAGIAAEAFGPMANLEKPSLHQKKLAQLMIEKKLVLDAIWPSSDVTPESLGADDESDVNPAALAADFLQSVRGATGRSV
jgi:hypothetical protein